jgi:hypothetical protein
LPALTFVAALALLGVSGAYALSRTGRGLPGLLFWGALLLLLVVPFTFRLASRDAGRGERVGLVCVLGVALYAVKVMHDPFAFTYADELVHLHNANEILSTGTLFGHNSILPVTTRYPGLESVTAGLAALSGLSTFGAGLVVLASARLVAMLALYLLAERLSGSARAGGLAALIYAANPNFVFFGAQFTYESLALPMALVVLVAALRRDRGATGRERLEWFAAAGLCTFAVVATHHMTSYMVALFLLAVAVVAAVVANGSRRFRTWPLAALAVAATVVWLDVVASSTVGYLTPVFTNALSSTFNTLSHETAPRQLFSGPGGATTPLWEHVVGYASVAIMAVGLPFGLLRVWRTYRRDAFALVLAAAAVGYFGVLALRFVPGAWETANRASEFLFVGLAVVLALTGLERWSPPRVAWLGQATLAGAAAVVFTGGIIAGWPPTLRLPHTYRILADGQSLDPEGVAAARWARSELGEKRRFAAPESNGRLLLAYADERAFIGTYPDVRDVLGAWTLEPWELRLLHANRIEFVLFDRRKISADNMRGYFFSTADHVPRYPSALSAKFDRAVGVSRVYDSGDVKIYDVRRIHRAPLG